jgi:hypothetical protein
MIQSTRHMCLIYEGAPMMHLPRILALLSEHLEARYRCLFLGNSIAVAHARTGLRALGIDAETEMQRGTLVLSSDQTHLANGVFSPEKMLEGLAQAVEQALKDGFTGLWATGDMTWEFGPEKNLGKLLKYECGLEQLFRVQPALKGICQYHQDTLPLHALGDALLSHPSLYINHTLHRSNPFYVPPETLLEAPERALPDSRVERILQILNTDISPTLKSQAA